MNTETKNLENNNETPVSEKTKNRINGLSAFFEEENKSERGKREREKEKIERENSLPISEKVKLLYRECLLNAQKKDTELSIDGDNNNQINATYVEGCYNPDKTDLDDANLYFNLLVLKMIQKFNIINYEYDTDLSKVDKSEYNMNNKFWKDKLIIDNGLSIDEKYVKNLETSFKQAFYTAFFNTVAQNADQVSYNSYKLKMKNILSFLDEEDSDNFEDQTIHGYFIDWLKKQTKEGSIVFVTPDITKFIEIDEPSTEDVVEKDKQQIIYLGMSENRMFYEINTDHFGKMMKGFKEGAFLLNGGDYIINPDKPLVYFNKVENPFIEDPILFLFNNIDFKFGKNNAIFARINDLED